MNSSESAEQIVRMYLQGFEVAARITGRGAERVGALLLAVMKDKNKSKGKTRLNSMLKSGKELKVFTIKKNELKKFKEEAKRYGVLYSALINKKDKDGICDIMVRSEDASKINRIVERFKLSNYDEVEIRSSIEKTKEEREKKKKKEEVGKKLKNEIEKTEEEINPHLATTEKSPLLEHSLKTQETLEKGSRNHNKPSVRKKLEKAKIEVSLREKSKVKAKVEKAKEMKKVKSR